MLEAAVFRFVDHGIIVRRLAYIHVVVVRRGATAGCSGRRKRAISWFVGARCVQPFFHAFGRFALSLVDEFVGFRSVSRVDVHASGIFYFVQGRVSAHVSQKIGYVIFSLNRDSAFPKGSSSARVCRNTGFWLLCGYLFGRRAYRSDNANSNKLLNTCRMSVSESFSLFSKKRKTYSSSL